MKVSHKEKVWYKEINGIQFGDTVTSKNDVWGSYNMIKGLRGWRNFDYSSDWKWWLSFQFSEGLLMSILSQGKKIEL